MTDSPVQLRPMRKEDVEAVHAVARAAFGDLVERMNLPPFPAPDAEVAHARQRHLVATDPGGCWVAEAGGRIAGGALALIREGVWGLSLLVVAPDVQSTGVGRALLERALAYGDGTRGGLILASPDPRALRAYFRAGFALHPALCATGVPRPATPPAGTRVGGIEDLPVTEAIDRAARGAAHGADVALMLERGQTLHLAGEDAYAVSENGRVGLLAARDDASGQDVLRAALAATPPGTKAFVDWLTARQDWAFPVVLDAGLELRSSSAVFTRGEVGPLRPYLPNGAFL